VSSIIYPSDFRRKDPLNELRIAPAQHAELMEERFFTPLAAEYHTFEPQCTGDCQFAVTSGNGQSWGCSFLKIAGSNHHSVDTNNRTGTSELPIMIDTVSSWRTEATKRAQFPDCVTCPAKSTCRKCPSFIDAGHMGDAYCTPSRASFPYLIKRIEAAVEHGFDFVHESARARATASMKAVC
jgi:hypothetical protein